MNHLPSSLDLGPELRRSATRYAVALVLCALCLLVRLATWPLVQQDLPFVLFLPAVLLSAWYGGAGPGILATALTTFAVVYFDLGAPMTFRHVTRHEIIALGIYVLACVALSLWRSAHLAATKTFEDLLEALPDGLVAVDERGRIVQVNSEAERLFGYDRKELLGQSIEMLVPERFRSDHRAEREEYSASPVRRRMGTGLAPYARRKDGSDLAVEVSLSPVNAGRRHMIASMIRDVTENRQLEATRRALTDRLKQLVEHSPTPVAIFDGDMRYLHASESWLPALGLPSRDIEGKSHYEIFPDVPERFREVCRRCLEGAVERCDEDPFPRANGSIDWLKWEVHPWRNAAGRIGGLVMYAENITERRQAAAALRDALGARDAFISAASHELRNPLSVLAMQVELLSRQVERGDGRVSRRLDGMNRQIGRLTKLIDHLLDVSRITAGKLELEIEDVDLSAVVKEVAARSSDELEESKCTLTVKTDGPAVGRWDRLRLDQVVTNLLSNAIKYGKGQPVAVTVDANEGETRLCVRDSGVGIDPDDQERIFERFERAESVQERRFPGIGLGLWIVRQIVDAMGGTIGVTSRPGEGSTFVVTLPRSAPSM